MSHGGGGDGSVAEPNLTPLLDVVLQLLMFFMMCVNFVTEQINEDIKLPVSEAARPMDKTENDVLFVNMKPYRPDDFKTRSARDQNVIRARFQEIGEPCLIVLGEEFPMRPVDLKGWLRTRYEDAKKNSKDGVVRTAIILRAHEDLKYQDVFDVMSMCKAERFTQLKLRAITKVGARP